MKVDKAKRFLGQYLLNVFMTTWFISGYIGKRYALYILPIEVIVGYLLILYYNGENVYAL